LGLDCGRDIEKVSPAGKIIILQSRVAESSIGIWQKCFHHVICRQHRGKPGWFHKRLHLGVSEGHRAGSPQYVCEHYRIQADDPSMVAPLFLFSHMVLAVSAAVGKFGVRFTF
jgi:hypothetical protein